MRRLMLLRHAKTETDAPSGRDFDRRLDARGQNDAEQMGRWIAGQQERPRRVLVSPAVRARQTWDIVAAVLPDAPETIEVEGLYNASTGDLLRAIQDHNGDATPLMIVAHNPGLHELAMAMTASGNAAVRRVLEDNLPTSGLAILDFDAGSWSEAGFRRGHLAMMISPRLLRDGVSEG